MTTAAQMRDRVAVVTGASTGIGAAIAERLAAPGAHLVLVARSADKLDGAAARLSRQYKVTVRAVPLDLADPTAAQILGDKLAEEGIEVEMLVNNAGVSALGPVAEGDPTTLRAVIALNAGVLTEITALLLPVMVARGHGTVINIASTAAYLPAPDLAAYAGSKAYVLSFTQALWAETKNTGVRVVAVSPGPTTTPMNPGDKVPGKRPPDKVAGTALRAAKGTRPSVIDGKVNALNSFVFSRLLPARVSATVLRIAMARTFCAAPALARRVIEGYPVCNDPYRKE